MRGKSVVLILCAIALVSLSGLDTNALISASGIHDTEFEAGFWASSALGWNKTYGGTAEDRAYALVQTVDDGHALAGNPTSSAAGNTDFCLIRTVEEGSAIVVPDDYFTIQEAINNANEGGTILVRPGTYYEHLVVNKTVSLVGEDVSTTIIDGNDTGHVVHVVRNNVNITAFTIRNSGHIHMPDLDAGICLNGTTGCIISENRIIDNGFSGISLLYSQLSKIVGNNVSGTEWGGIHMLGSSYNIVSRNVLDNTTHEYGVGINGHASSHYNTITENVISNSKYGMFYHDSRYNSICRNNISTISVEGIWLQDTVSHNVVTENNLVNCTTAIVLEGPNTNNTLSANFITGAEYGIKILNAQNNRLVDNVMVNNNVGSDSWRAGIRLEGGGYSQIHSNLISGNYYGILLYSNSPYVSVYGNNIIYNEFGLRVASGGSGYLNATNNVVANNAWYGIGLTGFGGSSNYATISQNTITNNSDGIALGKYSSSNTILQNNIAENECGFYIESSTQNSIYGNNVIDNKLQVNITSASTNVWDNGYPSGGNYWSDCSGTDSFCGVYQNETGSDGLVDEPYIIDASNKDSYPLVNPWAPQALTTDINNDGKVNILDITIVAKAFGSKQGESMYNEAADLDKSGQVNIIDISMVAKDFGKTSAGDTVTDYDGNIYRTIKIGNQTWMMENLRTTRLNDGQPIPYAPASSDWASLRAPGYCYPNNDSSNKDGYGCLYNWYTVDTGKLAPIGWHVPTDEEWKMLADYLGGEGVAGGELKKMGFTVRWAGVRTYDGVFGYFNEMEKYWTSTEGGWHPNDVWYYTITRLESQLSRSSHQKMDGHSVRCVKDASGPP